MYSGMFHGFSSVMQPHCPHNLLVVQEHCLTGKKQVVRTAVCAPERTRTNRRWNPKLTNLSQRNNEALAVAVLFARPAKFKAQITSTSGRPLAMLMGRPGHRLLPPTSIPP